MRKSLIILVLGLFVSASVANACDGDKACKAGKGKKAAAACMKNGKCTMAKDGKCDEMAAKTGGKCDMKAMKSASGAKHDCCKAKTATTSQKS